MIADWKEDYRDSLIDSNSNNNNNNSSNSNTTCIPNIVIVISN